MHKKRPLGPSDTGARDALRRCCHRSKPVVAVFVQQARRKGRRDATYDQTGDGLPLWFHPLSAGVAGGQPERDAGLRMVLTVGCNTKSDAMLGLGPDIKERLDELHKRKIELADETLVLNVDGSIGASRRSEIDDATQQGKRIRWLGENNQEGGK